MSTEEKPSPREAVKAVRDTLNDTNANVNYVTLHRAELEIVLEFAETCLSGVPVRTFKVGDKVQEICDDTGDELPVGTVLSLSATGMHVLLENTRHAGRKLFYYDNEVEAFGEKPEPAFGIGQKVELVDGFNGHGFIVTAGFEGTVREINDDGTFEVIFSTKSGTMGMRFAEADLKAVNQ